MHVAQFVNYDIVYDFWGKVGNPFSTRQRAANTRAQTPALLKGLIFTDTGTAMTPTHTKKGARPYRYYVSMDCLKEREDDSETAPRRLPAGMVEETVVGEIRKLIRAPEIVARMLAALADCDAILANRM